VWAKWRRSRGPGDAYLLSYCTFWLVKVLVADWRSVLDMGRITGLETI
jgi:hypothetical protein